MGLAGACLAAAPGLLISAVVPAMVVGGVHGGLAGYRRIYPWSRWHGLVAFVLDHTWALLTSAASVASQAVGIVRRDGVYIADLSERQARHVYAGGFQARRGFAVTLGTTVSGLADTSERRWRLVTEHEDVHVWQARWFGPSYPVLYLGWMVGGAFVGLVAALTRRRPVGPTIEALAYYDNPFEWWAYSREGRWPPPKLQGRVHWRRAMVRPLRVKPRTTVRD